MKTLNEVKWVVHYSDKWGDPVAVEYRDERDAREFYQRASITPDRSAVLYRADITLTPVEDVAQ
jgi:hypothetical protein